MIKELRAKTL